MLYSRRHQEKAALSVVFLEFSPIGGGQTDPFMVIVCLKPVLLLRFSRMLHGLQGPHSASCLALRAPLYYIACGFSGDLASRMIPGALCLNTSS